MSVSNPAHTIKRWSAIGMEGMFAKMFDPPKADNPDPATPDWVDPTNPVPAVMAAKGLQTVSRAKTVQRELMKKIEIAAWDGTNLNFFVFKDKDNPSTGNGTWPGAAIRIPRGVVFHCETSGHTQTPHTIHWHGIEPTPMNDGVGHCSMEIGGYTYQFQPNFIGTYFYHCHRNTVQHFEFGLYGMLLIEPPDAYFATQWDSTIPVGCGRDRKRRIAANLDDIRELNGVTPVDISFPDFIGGDIRDPDPEADNTNFPDYLKFDTNPHAMTVAYDVEALWVLDDRDSTWSDLADHGMTAYPVHGQNPGIDDNFQANPGRDGFFAFNDFNADYWFVTGLAVEANKGGEYTFPPGPATIPPALNSGVVGTQVQISAKVDQTILLRCLDAAYNSVEITFPLDIVIIAWDGRALGVPPFGFNHAYRVPANTPLRICTARRFDALIRSEEAFSGHATVKFINSRHEFVEGMADETLVTARIPINITE